MEVLRFRPPHGSTVEAQWKHSESPTEAPKEALMSFHGSTTEALRKHQGGSRASMVLPCCVHAVSWCFHGASMGLP